MAHTVYRYPIDITGEQTIPMPRGAEVLTVAKREGYTVMLGVGAHEAVEMWALVDPAAPLEDRRFRVAGTGHPLDDVESLCYLGTVQIGGGQLVFHIFEVDTPGL